MCKCIDKANRQLRETGARLATARIVDHATGRKDERVQVRTYRIKPTAGSRLQVALATHCPFCGEKYGVAP